MCERAGHVLLNSSGTPVLTPIGPNPGSWQTSLIVWQPEQWTLQCLVTVILYCIFCKIPPHKWNIRWVSTCHPLCFFRIQDGRHDGHCIHIEYGIWHNFPNTWGKWLILNYRIMFSSMQKLHQIDNTNLYFWPRSYYTIHKIETKRKLRPLCYQIYAEYTAAIMSYSGVLYLNTDEILTVKNTI